MFLAIVAVFKVYLPRASSHRYQQKQVHTKCDPIVDRARQLYFLAPRWIPFRDAKETPWIAIKPRRVRFT